MMFFIIIINIFYNIPVEFFLCADQGLDPSFESKSKQRIFLYHVFIKIPDFLRLCSKEIIVFKQFPELDQKIGMDCDSSLLLSSDPLYNFLKSEKSYHLNINSHLM